jgi:protein-arginine kinase activator protein McsA
MHRCSKTVVQGRRPGWPAGLRHVMQLSDAVETSSIALPEGLYKLNADMRIAVQMEDFKKAAELRDSIKAETAREPVARLLAKLKEAVDEQV